MGIKRIANNPINGKAAQLRKDSTQNAKESFALLRRVWHLCEDNGVKCVSVYNKK